ncbi:MAG TPA: NYN domain-containing protein, partial [Phycisphaerae bacterium]|nr:NYN domain-containing protein [Phycisphaerae bacterium]
IVFDGRPPREPAPFAPSLSVIYSGAGVSADSVLIGLVQRDSAPRRLIVVSTDREIAAAARRRRARAVRSDAFWRHVLHDLTRPVRRSVEPREKRTGLPPDQVDAWLRELGFEPQ